MKKMNIVLLITTFFTGIIAGLFFAWTISVMNGLAKLPDREFVLSMQSLNREIQNPVFFLFFFGTLLILPVCAFMNYQKTHNASFWFILIAMLLYLIGVIMITMAKNIPLNNMLDVFKLESATPDTISELRKKFEQPWNRWNLVRTLSSMFAFLLLLIGLVKKTV